jgi:hypothetical protein
MVARVAVLAGSAFVVSVFAPLVKANDAHVYIVAKSVSTSMEARRIITQNKWTESRMRQADFALVVVRSELQDPLRGSYDNICQLEEDADGQLNIAGSNFIVYVFQLDDDLRPTEVRHVAYPAT